MDLQELLEKTADPDFLREMIGFTAQRLMELEVESPDRRRPRRPRPRPPHPPQRLPRPGLGNPRRHRRTAHPEDSARAVTSPASSNRGGWREKALTAVIQEAYVQGVSTRSVDDLVQAMGMSGISKSQVAACAARSTTR